MDKVIPQFVSQGRLIVPNPEWNKANYAIVVVDEELKPIPGHPEIRSNDLYFLSMLQLKIQITNRKTKIVNHEKQ